MTSRLDELAEASGIATSYVSAKGEHTPVPDATKRKFLEFMGIDPAADAPPERLAGGLEAAPEAGEPCYVPEFLDEGRCWGITCQLYGLRSERNWGIGDFEDLARLAEVVADQGADFLGVNPLHALYPAEPERCSPYSPSSRGFLNVFYIAPDAEPEFGTIEAPPLADLQRPDLVAYGDVGRTKLAALEQMYRQFLDGAAADRRGDFETFRHEMGTALERHCLFEALHEHHARAPWWTWPDDYSRADSEAVRRFRAEHEERVCFFAWLQWLADRQLKRAQNRARAAGMRIGLYLDMAVGVAPDGAVAWADPDLMVRGVHIGAPPDALATQGQDWGLVPQSPTTLAARRLEPFRQDLRASMRHAGAVRLDHAMALQRLFWVPAGASPLEGAYVSYPLADMLAATAEESRRWHALVIGEALGTVPHGFTDLLGAREVQSYRVLLFERDSQGRFRPPGSYEARALGVVSTHDLPTVRGWWRGRDIEWRHEVGFIDAAAAEDEQRDRAAGRQALWRAVQSHGLVSDPAPVALDQEAVVAIHRYVASSPVRLMGVQLEDALGETEQPNLPGASEPHPNWRRKLPVALESLADHPLFRALCGAMAAQRPRR